MMSNNNDTDELTLEPFKEGDDNFAEGNGQMADIKGKRIVIISTVIAGLIVITALFFYFSASDTKVSSTNQPSPQQKTSSAIVLYEMPEITTNLAPTNEKESWIKIAITIQLENNKDQATIDKKLPMIKDAIIVFLRELRASDLSSSGGSMVLKTELVKRINKIMYPAKINDVLLREILLDQ